MQKLPRFDGPIIPVYNSDILKEYREVLSRPKFHLTKDIVDSVVDTIQNRGIHIEAEKLDITLPDPHNQNILLSFVSSFLILFVFSVSERKGGPRA